MTITQPPPAITAPGVTVYHGDCIEVMRQMPDNSIDAIVTDPPYGLEFMGKEWDGADGFRRSLNAADAGRDNVFGRSSRTSPEYRAGHIFQEWVDLWAAEALRVLKPGGHMLAFGGSRTWHRLAAGIEDAGFEIRDSIAWLYGQGFPKSMNVGADERFCQCPGGESAHGDSTAEHAVRVVLDGDVPAPERTVVGAGAVLLAGMPESSASTAGWAELPGAEVRGGESSVAGRGDIQTSAGELRASADGAMSSRLRVDDASERVRSATPAGDGTVDWPSTDEAGMCEPQGSRHLEQRPLKPRALSDEPGSQARRGWPICGGCGKPQVAGWGTALKPAFEPIVVARKPLAGTVAQNVLAHGTGALHIDACRIPTDDKLGGGSETRGQQMTGGWHRPWMDDADAVAANAERARASVARSESLGRWPTNVVIDEHTATELDRQAPATGGTGKASGPTLRGETDATVAYGARKGLDGDPAFHADGLGGASKFFPTFRYQAKPPKSERPLVDGVAHPTVKPVPLIQWLMRLVVPPGGTVLDPFVGSGTAVEAALLEQFEVVAIEREADYLPLIDSRIDRPILPSLFGEWA